MISIERNMVDSLELYNPPPPQSTSNLLAGNAKMIIVLGIINVNSIINNVQYVKNMDTQKILACARGQVVKGKRDHLEKIKQTELKLHLLKENDSDTSNSDYEKVVQPIYQKKIDKRSKSKILTVSLEGDISQFHKRHRAARRIGADINHIRVIESKIFTHQ